MAVDNISKFYNAFSAEYDNFKTEDDFRKFLSSAKRENIDNLFGAFSDVYDNFSSADEMISYLGWKDSSAQAPVDTSDQIVQDEAPKQPLTPERKAQLRAFNNKMMGTSSYADRPQEDVETAPEAETPAEPETPATPKQESTSYEPLNLPYNGEFQPEANETESVSVPEAPANADEMAEQNRRQREIDRYALGGAEGKPYSADEAIETGKHFEEISPYLANLEDDINKIEAKYKAFLDSLEKTEDGRYTLKNREQERKFNQYLDEVKPYFDAYKDYQAMLETPAGKEYAALTQQMQSILEEPETPERNIRLTQLQDALARNPIYRASAGENAPSESELEYNRLRAEQAQIKEWIEGATHGSDRRRLKKQEREILEKIKANTYFQSSVIKGIAENERALEELNREIEPYLEQLRRSKTGVAVVGKDFDQAKYDNLRTRVLETQRTLRKLQHLRDGNESDFFANMADVFSDPDFLTQGVYGLRTILKAKLAEKNPEAEGARELLETIVTRQNAEQMEGEFVNWVGRAGQLTANMIPFVATIGMVNGWSSVAEAVGGGLEKWIYGRMSEEAAKRLGTQFLVHAIGATVGDIAAGIVSANTIGLGNTAKNIAERYYGHLVQNEDGSFGFIDGEEFYKAFAKGEVSNSLEYWSERFGDHLQHILGRGILRFAQNRPGMQNIATSLAKTLDTDWKDIGISSIESKGLSTTIDKIIDSAAKFTNRIGVQGYPFEVIEEEVNILGNIIFQTGDNTWKDFQLDSDTQKDIWGGMLFSIGGMQAFSIAGAGLGKGFQSYMNNKTYKMLESNLMTLSDANALLLGEDRWEDIKHRIDNSGNKELADTIQELVDSKEYTKTELDHIRKYVEQTYIYRGFNKGTLDFVQARLYGDESLRSLNINETLSFAETEIGNAYMMGYQSKVEDEDKINKVLQAQRERMKAMFGVEDMTRDTAMELLNSWETGPEAEEAKDAILDYMMALASAQGIADKKVAMHDHDLAIEEAGLIKKFGGKYYIYRTDADGNKIAEHAFMDTTDGTLELYILSNEATDKGMVPAIASDGKYYMVGRGAIYSLDENGNKVVGQTTVTDYSQLLEDKVAERKQAEEAAKRMSEEAQEHSETLSSLQGRTVYISGRGAYEPVTVERMTQGGEYVVIRGDKEALKAVAEIAGIASPGGSMLEVPVESLYPLLAKDEDGTLSIGEADGKAPVANEAVESLQNLVGQEVSVILDGVQQNVTVNKVGNGKVQYVMEGDDGALVARYLPVDEFVKAMEGTQAPEEAVEPEPEVEPEPVPEPAPTPEPTPEPTPAPAPAEISEIPVDPKTGEFVYDDPKVTPKQAYDSIYSQLKQKNADAFVMSQYKAARAALDKAEKVVSDGAAEKEEIDNWDIKDGEGINAFNKRQAEARAKVDAKIAKAQADITELQRKVDFWGELREVAQRNVAQREAEAKRAAAIDTEPRDVRELISQELTSFFKGGGKLYLPSVLAFVGENKRKELLKKYPGCFADDLSKSMSIDDFAHNVLAGSVFGYLVTDTHAAADEASTMLLNMGRKEMADMVKEAREKEKKEAAENDNVDPVIVLTDGNFKTGDAITFPTIDGRANGTIMGVDPDNKSRIFVSAGGGIYVSLNPGEIAIAEEDEIDDLPMGEEIDDLPLSVAAKEFAPLLSSIQRKIDNAISSDERDGLMEQKADAIRDMLQKAGINDARVCTNASITDAMKADGVSDAMRKRIREGIEDAEKKGNAFRGIYLNGHVYIVANGIMSSESAKLTYVHESKHFENEKTRAHEEAMKTGVTEFEMRVALVNLSGTHTYDTYTGASLANEVIAHAAEIAERFGVDGVSEKLREAGITNEDFINFVENNIRDGRRNDQHNLLGVRSSLQHDGSQVNSQEDGRTARTGAGALEGQSDRADESGRRYGRSGESEPKLSVVSGEEGAVLADAVNKKNNIYKQGKPVDYAFTSGRLYVYENPYYNGNYAYSNGEINVITSVPIGDDALINAIKESINNGTYETAEAFDRDFEDFRRGRGYDSRDNVDAPEQREGTRRPSSLDRQNESRQRKTNTRATGRDNQGDGASPQLSPEVTEGQPLFSVTKESQELFDAAKERFGTTRDIREAGYVLPDGAMLDFSGRHSLAPGSDSSYLSGRRAIDHRDIEDLNFERDLNTPSGRNTNMADFISRGAVRMHYPGAINLANKPTPEQVTVLSRLIDRSDGDVWVEFGAGTTEHYVEYESARPSRIINDINRYYDDGVKPEGNILFSVVNKNQEIFISNAASVAEDIKMEKATPEQWLKMLEKGGGLKAGEDKWIGLSDWLKSQKGTVTKQQVLDYINQNKIQIEEQPYADGTKENYEEFDWFDYLKGRYGPIVEDAYFFMPEGNGNYSANVESTEKAVEFYNQQHPDAPITPEEDEYRGYILTDEEYDTLIDFGEQLLQEVRAAEDAFNESQETRPINSIRLSYTTEGLKNKKEIALTVPTIEPWNERDEIHFGDAGGGRAVAWVRFGDTDFQTPVTEKEVQEFRDSMAKPNEYEPIINANGKTVWFPFGDRMSHDFIVERDGRFTVYINEVPINTEGSLEEAVRTLTEHVASYQPNKLATRFVLVIDEIQSKRHQEGREKGYDYSPELQRIENESNKAILALEEYAKKLTDKYGKYAMSSQFTREELMEYNRLNEVAREASNRASEARAKANRDGVAMAPFEKNWHELAMKRMLRYAAEEGYDYVAWTTGEQQAERYDLGAVLHGIERRYDRDNYRQFAVNLKDGGEYNIRTDQEGNIKYSSKSEFQGHSLSEVFGKDMASKMMSMSEKDVINGENLRIGGEGMKGFYDEILPRFMNKYAKKWGVSVSDIELPIGEEDTSIMHAIPVTDEMRESVMQGQPMFSVVRDPKKIKELEEGEKVEGYRTVVLNPDGSLGSPMAGSLSEAGKGKSVAQSAKTTPFNFGVWEMSEENPHLADDNGKIRLNKTDNANRGLTSVDRVDYNPYIHLRLDTINRQFKDAWKRPDLIYIKSEVPKSEVDGTNPYQAEKAAKATGVHDWNGGKLMLTRYDKPIEQVAWEDVADSWASDKKFQKNGVHFDIVPPQILDMLQEKGIRIIPPHNGMGEDCNECYKAWLQGDTEAYESWRDKGKAPEDGGIRASVVSMEREITDKTISAMPEKMGIPVNRVSPDEMPMGHSTDKGYYNPDTNEVSICMDNVNGERDAIATVLHESVGYRGLEGLLGSRYDKAMADIYAGLDNAGRSFVNGVIAREGLGAGDPRIKNAIMEYLSGLAESRPEESEALGAANAALGEAVDSMLGTAGFSFTDNELLYMLRASNEYLQNPAWLNTQSGRALDTVMKRELGINESDPNRPTDPDGPGTGPLFSVVRGTGVANADYNADMKLWYNTMITEHQDSQQPARLGIKRVMQEKKMSGIEDDADYLTSQNLASSRSETQAFEFMQLKFNPLVDHVNDIIKKLTGKKSSRKSRNAAYERILNYLYAMSGLERNAYKNAEVEREMDDALNAARERAEKAREEVRNPDGYHYSPETEAKLIKKIDDDLAKEETDIVMKYTARKRDWSGITSLMGRPASEWHLAEVDAQAMIDAFKAELGNDAMLDALWDYIRACTDYNLEHAYKYGLLTREEFERLHGTSSRPRMWNYYLPLRGFSEKTAEEEYQYGYSSIVNGGGVVEKANGRWTQADNPIANIMNIALREIVQGNENWAKQALYQFVLDAGENSLLSVREPWFIRDTGTGKWIPAEPDETRDERMEEFEQRMQDLKDKGDAKKGRRGLKLDMILANKGNRNEHMIRLKVNGMERNIWVNGDPAMARAVNNVGKARNMQWFRRASRKVSNLFTTYSLNFSIRNLFRDTRYSRRRLKVMEDGAYRWQYKKNWWNNLGYGAFAAPMMRLMYMWESGKLFEKEHDGTLSERERMFMDFMRDGGQTGYTIIQSMDRIKKDIENSLKLVRSGAKVVNIPIIGHIFEGIKTLNEGFELLTRFTAYQTSRDMGRSGQRAASDAKEISVNFNRRGAQSGEGFWGMTAAYLGATHYFYNAGVQGFDNFLRLFKAKPVSMTAKMTDFVIMGMMMPLLNAALAGLATGMGKGGDDDDDWYWDLPEYVRRNFIVVGVPGGYITMPLPQEFRAFYGLGDIVAGLMCGKTVQDSGFDVGMDVISTMADLLPMNPVEGYSSSMEKWYDPIVRSVTPDILMFGVDVMTNRDYTGRPLYKENPFSHTKPLSQGAYASTPKYLVDACTWLAEQTSDKELYLDWSPGIFRDALKNYGGGPYKLIEDVLKLGLTDEERPRRWDNIPFFSGFTGHLDEDRRDSFESNALHDYKANMEEVVSRLNSAAGTNDITESMAFDHPEDLPAGAKTQSILDGEKYIIAKMFHDGMKKQLADTYHYEFDKKGQPNKVRDVKRKAINDLRKDWKEMRAELFAMPSGTQEEKDAKEAFALKVQEAWHLYYDAEAELLDKLMEEQFNHVQRKLKNGIPYEPKPTLTERVFNATKDMVK